MNTIYLISLCWFACSGLPSDHPSLPLHDVKLEINSNNIVISRVNLKRTERALANKHLPIWILNDRVDFNSQHYINGEELKRDYEVMEQLGGFTTYQEPETSSAAIYFHKRHEFDGMIGYELLIRQLSVDEIYPTGETSVVINRNGVYNRPGYIGHKNDCKKSKEDPGACVNYQRNMKTYGGRVYDGYPEILVIVSWDVAKEWTRNVQTSNRYATIVSNVLTLFNGVDMLYSKLHNTNIQINIAGIIMGKAKESFRFIRDCYYRGNEGNIDVIYGLKEHCVARVLQRYLYARKKKIPLDSYDIFVFLTSENIYRLKQNNSDNEEEILYRVQGMGRSYNLYDRRRNDKPNILSVIITLEGYLDRYPTIAHEMAHAMTMKHDVPPFFTCNEKCCGNIMKTSGGWCNECLLWSESSEYTFSSFFSSPNCCTFINKPRSLYPPGQQLMLTADEQCQCYGYEFAVKFMESARKFCHTPLQCQGAGQKFYNTAIPMDGTPCAGGKVCWQKRC